MKVILPAIFTLLVAWVVTLFTLSNHLVGIILWLASPLGLAVTIVTGVVAETSVKIPRWERILLAGLAALLFIAFGLMTILLIMIVSVGGFSVPD